MSGLVSEAELTEQDREGTAAEDLALNSRHNAPEATAPLLLEVGCEEIPARFLRDAEKGLGEHVLAALLEARLLPEQEKPARKPLVLTYSTPRRLAVYAARILAQQRGKVEEIVGPPVKVAIDGEGKFTRAAESFAERNSVRPEDLIRTATPKGEYLSLRKVIQGRPAGAVLAEVLPTAILGLSFPKSMYWTSKMGPRFVRPIRWIVASLGEGENAATVEFEVLGVKSGKITYGHRSGGRRPLYVSGFRTYMKKLRKAHVEIDYAGRCTRIVQEVRAVLGDLPGRVVEDEWLVDWIANATEWPRPILGSFDERFLHLPREILITVMRDHQRYFAVEDAQGSLRPQFVAVLNMDSDERGLIRQGHQRVLTARFRDAEFFWSADQRIPLAKRLPLLEKVTYQAKLGSYADKVKRVKAIADDLCAKLEADGMLDPAQSKYAQRAAELCKCDLTTQMVQEFTELQGVVGGLYARTQGEPEEVATAIYDHYMPAGAEGQSPRTLAGALVSIADKVDSVVAGFAAGNEPTGSKDPFALRRQANGLLKVLLEYSLPINLNFSVEVAINYLQGTLPFDERQVREAIEKFMRERLSYHLEATLGLRYDTVRAAMGAGWYTVAPLQVVVRAEAVERIRTSPDFVSLSQSAKRIRNILSKSAKLEDYEGGGLDPERLEAGPERDLYEISQKVNDEAAQKRGEGDVHGALESIATMRPQVDAFFDKVLVMAEDSHVRRNRLHLLLTLDRLFNLDADLSEIEGNVDASTTS